MITGFLLKRPDKTRRTFQLIPYRRHNGKKIYSKPVESPELESLNASLLAGRLTAAQVESEIKGKLLPELKRRAGTPQRAILEASVSENNLRVFKDFWSAEYRRKRLEDPATAKHEFHAALRILEPLSLHTCTVDELQDHWDKKEKGTRHKRYGNRVNQLLKFLKRGFEIETDRAVVPELRWVTWDELNKILEFVVSPELRALYRSLYGTGARLGELFVIDSKDVRANGSLYINRQLDRNLKLKPYTKNKISHDTVILEEALESVHEWAAVKDKAGFRKRCQHPLINAAHTAFPSDRTKQISPHKLRHSYVKQMLTLGVPLERIAQMLGDRSSTLETVYRQWRISDSEVDYVKQLMAAGYKRVNKS